MNELIYSVLANGWDYRFLASDGGCMVFFKGNESLVFDNDADLLTWLKGVVGEWDSSLH